MTQQIKLTRYRNIDGARREKGDVLTIGEDIPKGHAETLVNIGGAEWVKAKAKKKADK